MRHTAAVNITQTRKDLFLKEIYVIAIEIKDINQPAYVSFKSQYTKIMVQICIRIIQLSIVIS